MVKCTPIKRILYNMYMHVHACSLTVDVTIIYSACTYAFLTVGVPTV